MFTWQEEAPAKHTQRRHEPDLLSLHYRLKHKLKLVPEKKDWTPNKSSVCILQRNEDVVEMWWEGWQEFDVSVDIRGNAG